MFATSVCLKNVIASLPICPMEENTSGVKLFSSVFLNPFIVCTFFLVCGSCILVGGCYVNVHSRLCQIPHADRLVVFIRICSTPLKTFSGKGMMMRLYSCI